MIPCSMEKSGSPAIYAFRDSRVPARCHATLRVFRGTRPPLGGTVVNLSRSGMRVSFREGVNAPCAKGDKISVVATLPFLYGEFSANADVIWARTKDNVAEVGLRYVEVDAADEKRLRDFLNARPTQVLFVGCAGIAPVIAASLAGQPIFPTFLTNLTSAHKVILREEVSTIVVGDELAPAQAFAFLDSVYTKHPLLNAPSVVFAAGADFSPFAQLVSTGQIFFLTQKSPQPSEMAAIVVGCVDRYWVNVRREEVEKGTGHATDDALFQHVLQRSQIANRQTSAKDLCQVSEEAIRELTDCSRAYCLFHDQDTETLWAPATDTREEREVSTAAGIVSYAARTAIGATVERASDDARYDPDADDPTGQGGEQILVEPILTIERRVAAVLVAIRDADAEPFTREHQAALRIFASQLTATFGRLVTQIQIDRMRAGRGAEQAAHPFSEDAMQEYLRGQGEIGHLLRLHSPWIENAFFTLLGFMAIVLAFLTFAKVNDYGHGVAIVRLERKLAVTAKSQGVVTQVPVQVGQKVSEGTVLAVLDDSREHAELLRVEHDLDQELIRWLRDPSDSLAGRQIAQLRAAREVALAAVHTRTVVSPQAGVINDIRAMPGQVIGLGDTVVSMSNADDPAYTVLAVFPGRYRPQARVGAQLRLEFVGYPFSYQTVTIASLGEEVVGPKEARRIVGSEQADSIAIDGPVFVAKGQLASDGFTVDGIKYGYFDGLVATAQVKLRGEPILVMLVPGLRRIYDAWNPQ